MTIATIIPSTSFKISGVNLRSSSNTNTTLDNLILSWDLSGADEDQVKVITSWYVNDQIINILTLPFESGSNSETTFDYASNSSASVNGATWSSDAGHDGFGAYSFTNDASIDLASPTGYLDEYTISVWLKRDLTNQWDMFASGNTAAQYFGIHPSTNRVIASYKNSTNKQNTCYSNIRIEDTSWHHVVITGKNDGYINMYIDGVKDRTTNCRQPITNGGFNTAYSTVNRFGNSASSAADYGFNGTLDDVQVYDRALSQEQVMMIYQNQPMISNTETNSGDVWNACVVGADQFGQGNMVCSNELEIS